MGESLDHCGLAHPGLAGQDGVVLPPAHQDVDDLPNLLVAPHDRIHLAISRTLSQVHRVLAKSFLLAHGRWGHRPAGLSGRCAAAGLKPVAGAHGFLGRALDDGAEPVAKLLDLDLVELAGHG